MPLSRRLLAPLLAAPLLLGCTAGSEDGGQTEGPGVAETVAGLPGVEDVSVGESNFEEDSPAVTTVVAVLEPDPTVEEVGAVLAALADPGTEEPILTATYVGTNAAYTTGPTAGVSTVRDVSSEGDVEQAAEILVAGLALVEELGGDSAIDVDYDPEFDNDDSGSSISVLPASDAQRDVDAAVAAVADDPVLSGAGALVAGQELP